MGHGVQFRCTFADGKPLSVLSDTIGKRMKYLNETAFQSIHAIAIDVLKSIRGVTRVAKPSSIKVKISHRSDLVVSFTTIGGSAAYQGKRHRPHRLCIRDRAGNRLQPASGTKFIFASIASASGASTKNAAVYEFVDDFDGGQMRYLICATSTALAKAQAQKIVARRLLRYAGLAKRAMSALMIKTNTRGPSDSVSARVYQKANEVTSVNNQIATNSDGSGVYSLLIQDNLRYAKRAVKGEAAAIDMALKKAANRSIGLIRHKCKDLLLPGEIKTPFPEIVKSRKVA